MANCKAIRFCWIFENVKANITLPSSYLKVANKKTS